MKNLFYKELKLAFHPVIIVFIVAFPFMILIPNYPLFIGFIYICAGYPILFLGANKGKQSNDIIYSALLPVAKKDIIKARMMTLTFMQIVSFSIMGLLTPLAYIIQQNMAATGGAQTVGIPLAGFVSMLGFAFISFGVYDFIYLVCFYKKGRSILLPTFLGMFVFMLVFFSTTVILPMLSRSYYEFFTFAAGWLQVLFMLAGFAIYCLIRYFGYLIAKKELEKADL